MNKNLLWPSVILGVVVVVILLAVFASGTPSEGGNVLSAPVTTDEHIKGNPDAKITLVEYSDFQCPACGSMYPIVKQLADTYPNDLRVVYRHYPLRQIHPQAQLAAQATEAAAMQGKFWDMHDALFNTQTTWADSPDAENFFVQLAESVGLDTEKFQADMNSTESLAAVNEDAKSGNSANVPGTPTFFLQGNQIENPGTLDGFKMLIEDKIIELDEKNGTPNQ